ncbi:hypothetical protein GLS40_15170 [Pseudooceanicola sp. 216_PA32_1]|uniref:Reverse transcriptase domain-containing protein n=1 Tax=Pseudooceanicola pacificus TaxID=2676438 RepID=A0A844WGS1_9RHOB|nr:antiviral reverse transcriptase Drt3b [Pseudooceanicola pacificus]MWB79379.1 hypothetical protein [Pseudooceanicola pacificus]
MLDPIFNRLRPLLTETLPYDVPVNFSNEYLFVSEARKSLLSDSETKFLDTQYRRRLKDSEYTVPFSYPIRRTGRSPNKISIVHPLQQLQTADFIFDYSETILLECSESKSSLRAPFEVLPAVSKKELKRFGDVKKIGIPHVAPEDGKLDLGFAPSFFSIRKYNLLDKFHNSNEIIRLESKFPLMRSVDVTKCFFNIYTHSITWAVKGKGYSKQHANKYSFEGRFDTLMQRSNYNETNGIVVGPEVSRIFAEIIFQKVDENIHHDLRSRGLQSEREYAIRRYVDDYFLFASDERTLQIIYDSVERNLEDYKLYLNDRKSRAYKRPFVTNITRAKQGVSDVSKRIVALSAQELAADDQDQVEIYHQFRQALEDLRIIVSDNGASFAEATGSTYFQITRAVRHLRKHSESVSGETETDLVNRVRSIIRILFYIVSSDFRVSPIFRTYQIVEEIILIEKNLRSSEAEAMRDRLVFEICELISANLSDETGLDDGKLSLEACNLLLLGSMIGPKSFPEQDIVKELSKRLQNSDSLSYFSFVALMYLYGNAGDGFSSYVDGIAGTMLGIIGEKKDDVRTDTEAYLIMSDFLSCPFVTHDHKRNALKTVYGVEGFPNDTIDRLALHVAFVDWKGARTSHFLKRKRLQPVYHLLG